MLTGDDPRPAISRRPSRSSTSTARRCWRSPHRMRREQRLPSGTEIKGDVDLALGAADLPLDPPRRLGRRNPDRQARCRRRFRADAVLHGCGDRAALRRAARRAGHRAERVKVLIGVAPDPVGALGALDEGEAVRHDHSRRDRRRGSTRRQDAAAEGIRICVETDAASSPTIPGIAGAHVMAPQNPSAIAEVLAGFDTATPL